MEEQQQLPEPISDEERARRLRDVDQLLAVIAPVVEQDGGAIRLGAVDPDSGVIALTLTGACGSCAVSSDTLSKGIARILAQRLSWFTRLDGAVEESSLEGSGGWRPR
jgi:Fe-S cluster biogenesis protein NfuA